MVNHRKTQSTFKSLHSLTHALTYTRTHLHMHSLTHALTYTRTHLHMHSLTLVGVHVYTFN